MVEATGRRLRREWPVSLALALLGVALSTAIGPVGVVVAIVTAAFWYALGVPYALAAGHVALVAVMPGGLDPLAVIVAEAGFGALLATVAVRSTSPARVAAVALGGAVLAGVTIWIVLGTTSTSTSIWIAAAAVCLVLATAGYTLHRFQLVRLGLVTESIDAAAAPTRGPTDRPTGPTDLSEDPTVTTASAAAPDPKPRESTIHEKSTEDQ